jgi:hypothetical protein
MSMTNQAAYSTIRKAGQIIGAYIEPGPHDAGKTINQLIDVLDNQDLARTI